MLHNIAPVAPKGKRTNSLAFCQTDCHTCASTGLACDRRRPQCSKCLDQGRKCGGFATPLSWDDKRIWVNNSWSTETPATRAQGNTNQSLNDNNNTVDITLPTKSTSSRRFRFVEGDSRARKRRRTCPPQEEQRVRGQAREEPILLHDDNDNPMGINRNHGLSNIDTLDQALVGFGAGEESLIDDAAWLDSGVIDNILDLEPQELPAAEVAGVSALCETPSVNMMDGFEEQPRIPAHDQDIASLEPINSCLFSTPNNHIEIDFASSPLHMNSGLDISGIAINEHDGLLQMCKNHFLVPIPSHRALALLTVKDDTEFCVLPLTSDMAVNPFRCHRQISQGSRLLFHSILALCCHHLDHSTGTWSTESSKHRSTAVQILETTLQKNQVINGLQLLEPILVMFTLDCTLSAAGNWLTHLTRAHSILQASGGANALRTPRFRSQVAMLVWWDATLALISRQGTVFDRAYRDFLIKWEQKDEWSFFELTGCPGDLLVHLFYLAELAKQKELASSMEWLTFNMTPIESIEGKVIEWENEMIPHVVENDHQDEQEEEKQIHDHQDRYHCAEAWRYSLLIYVERVFKWDRQQRRRPYSIAQLVRTTLDHVRSCRRTSQTQKQLLLPVFLAGSETTDADMRRLVKGYCKHWAEKSRYDMFYSASLLLDEIWMASPSQWWGAVIDQKTRISTGSSPMVTQFLFG